METTDIAPLLEDIEGNIDELEDALQPLLKVSLLESTSTLPLLDKAKLYILATYAIESILFSYLRLNGTDAKEHPVFRELTRVKQYFEKVKTIESGGARQSTTRLDKNAANRFIKHSLAGNEKYDRERAAQEEVAKASAQSKLESMSQLAKRKASDLGGEGNAKDGEADGDNSRVSSESEVMKFSKKSKKSKRQSKKHKTTR